MEQIKNNTVFKTLLSRFKKETLASDINHRILNLLTKSVKVLRDEAERRVPENNKFTKFFVCFDIPQTRREAFISISHDEINPKDMRRLAVEVHNADSDKFYSQYIFKGTKKEILKYLSETGNIQTLHDAVTELSKKVSEDSF